MLTETFITSILAQPKSANTAISKDLGIYVHNLQPHSGVQSSFKKSSTHPNGLAVSSTHIFAVQADKAIVHVYSREKGNQESLVSFPERIRCIHLIHDGLLALGSIESRIFLWETLTGRQVVTPASHLQAITSLASTPTHLISGSEDSNIHVWSIPSLLSFSAADATTSHEPLRSLSNHRSAITALRVGHSTSNLNIVISASKDQSCIVWNYHSGELLRTFLLPSSPLCLELDPVDRAFYIGFEDGSIRAVDLFDSTTATNTLYDPNLHSTPIQISPESAFAGSPSEVGKVLALGLSYDGTVLLSGHDSGKLVRWDAGPKKFSAELADHNAPVTNIVMVNPMAKELNVKAITVVKPRVGVELPDYKVTAQLVGSMKPAQSAFERALYGLGVPDEMLEQGILELAGGAPSVAGASLAAATPAASAAPASNGAGDEKLRKENEELLQLVDELRGLQKRTFEKYKEAKGKK
jgi:pre-rRNA-processing protein IPI3